MDYRMSSKKRSQKLLLLVLELGMAMVCVMLLSKLREARVFGHLLRDQDQQILTLQLLLQAIYRTRSGRQLIGIQLREFIMEREKENSKAMKRKLEDFRTKNFILRNQKTLLSNKLMEKQTTADHLQKMQNEMEASLEEKENQVKSLSEKADEPNLKVADLSKLLKQKETEVEEAKKQIVKLSTNSTEGREANTENEAKTEQNEETPKEGKWVKFQTNGIGEASDNNQNEKSVLSQGSMSEIREQSEELRNGEEQETDTGREIEMSQESTLEIKEESKEPESNQLILINVEQKEQKEIVAAQDEQEKPTTPKELRIEADGKEHKVRRNKNRGKGGRGRTTPRGREYEKHSTKEDNKYGSVEKNELEGERKEIARETAELEISDGSQVDGGLNSSSNSSQGQINSEARDDIAFTKEQSEKSENPRKDEAMNESKEESNANAESIPKQTDVATAATEDDEGSKV